MPTEIITEPEITTEIIRKHGLNQAEFQRIRELLDRDPSFTELGIFSAMWNEHCSYKSSKIWLKTLPVDGPQVICGPGENAGIVDIGDGQCVVFKMESHNHPSYIEPFQGAATGIGGILRDVFTMGARPVAAMNALSFGEPSHPKTKQLVNGVVEGIGSYGNCFGVPNVGGEMRFHKSYNGNCLVNAFAAGIANTSEIFYSAASGIGMPVVYLGAKTGRDGVGGATMASAEFDDTIEEKRPTVQVGDPFTEKRLMEATLELMQTGAVISIQDMGAAGLTCSAVEMGDKGGLGVVLDLEKVPCREENMTAYEMMLSESQERMLMVLHPHKEAEAKAVFDKWDLDFAIIGETIAEDHFLIRLNGEIKADLPLKALSGEAPEYDRPWVETPTPEPYTGSPDIDIADALLKLIGSPNHASKAWIWSQYDHMVLADTVIRPGSDAGVIRVHGTEKLLAFTSDVNPRYCFANPEMGGKQAVAEAYRNQCATGARPLATTDNLNFGNPERPEIMGQLVGCIKGIGAACKALDMPIVSGNVSLYNETDGAGIHPTPTIGAVGILDNIDQLIRMVPDWGDDIILLGKTGGHLGQSALLADVLGLEIGDAPNVDLILERAAGEVVRHLHSLNLITAAHDLSDGGIALGVADMCLMGKCGAVLQNHSGLAPVNWYFGEDQGRYLLACSPEKTADILTLVATAEIDVLKIGQFGGAVLMMDQNAVRLDDLKKAHDTGLTNVAV
ncbi:MAG: phosphoribosylformylglycinamidine synthase subunit PurL [Rhodobacteraceae bacterium]|nr:phosphoribosylformylglycinamidine synthase subunit PurL [Paracoccaceae bacterium]